MTYKLNKYVPSAMRSALCATLLGLCAVLALYPLYLRLMAGINDLSANNYIREGYYGLALESYKRAAGYQPRDHETMKGMGEAYYELGALKQKAQEAWPLAVRSREFYDIANRLNPLDAEAAYGLARAEFRLEQLHAYLHPEQDVNPYNALPWFKESIRLRPNSISFRYAMARYLHYHDDRELLPVVRALSRAYPPSYSNLRKEEFWSPEVRDEVKKGLEQALEDQPSPRQTHKVMSNMLAEEGRWDEAISHYNRALRYRKFENTAGDYIQLGYFNLMKGDLRDAEINFITGLDRSMARESDLSRIYRYYRAEDRMDEYYRFYDLVKERFIISIAMEILFARSLVEKERYDQAREVLMEVNNQEDNAEACYWLARIAEKEQDWDSMELLIQKATVLEPRNSNYHLVFSNVLRRLKKLERAEKEATLALQYQANPSPWTFNHRASIRWALEDFEGAAKDWRSAISLRPDHAAFYALAAEAYAKIAYWPMAAEYYKKALDLDPENERYKKRYAELKEFSL